MIQLHITVVDKVATYLKRGGRIVCGNSDYEVKFTFDKEWDAFPVKTARFIYNGQHTDVVFEGSTCKVPVLTGTTLCAVGVFAGDLCTTTPALIPCAKSILCEDGSPADPPEDVYNQIMALLNRGTDGEGRAYANALQGTVSGEGAVVLDDVSPIAHVMGVKVTTDNIVPTPFLMSGTTRINGVDLTINDDYSITLSGTATATNAPYLTDNIDATPYIGKTISIIPLEEAANAYISVHLYYKDGTKTTFNWMRSYMDQERVVPENASHFVVGASARATFSGTVTLYPYIKLGAGASKYAPYDLTVVTLTKQDTPTDPTVEPIEYEVNADGTVDGVAAIHPTTTLTSDTEGVVITAQYNRDLTKAYAAQQQEIEELKQAVMKLI